MIDLPADYLQIIKKLLALYIPHATVWAYGSRVKGTAHQGSDLDLVVINKISSDDVDESIKKLRTALQESQIPILIDLRNWDLLPEDFKQEIEKEHEVIQ